MIRCRCLVCKSEWEYKDGIDEDMIRASCSPCGHQGMFEIIKGFNNQKEV